MTELEIRYFLEIVDQGVSFTKASGTLYVSQPALTKHINTLSKELGSRLFDTSKKHAARLTPAGELYYRFFSEARDQFKKIREKAKALADEHYGDLLIAFLKGWNMGLLPSSKAFCKAYPHILLSLYSGGFREIKNGLLNNKYDLVVTFSKPFQGLPDICVQDISSIPCILLFSADHSLAGKQDLEITDFKDDTFYIIAEGEGPFPKQDFVFYCKSKGFIPRFQAMPNLDSVLLALQNGSGYTIIDTWMRQKDDAAFKYLPLDFSATISSLWKADNANKALPLFLKTCVPGMKLSLPDRRLQK
jgi:DNA-binding transcriptional LysR family regulator